MYVEEHSAQRANKCIKRKWKWKCKWKEAAKGAKRKKGGWKNKTNCVHGYTTGEVKKKK